MNKCIQTVLYHIILCCILHCNSAMPTGSDHSVGEVKIGLVLDLNSSLGKMAESCIEMAYSDFYKSHPDYRTKLIFRTENSHGVLNAASKALELLKNDEIRAILGPQTTPEAKFVVELGAEARVPIVSFSATSSSLSPVRSPYFVRMAGADSFQSKAFAAIIEGFGWQDVVIVYENTGYHDEFIRNLSDAIREAGVQISLTSSISVSANDSQIVDEVYKLKAVSARVFLVHMTSLDLGSRFFVHAKTAGNMVASKWSKYVLVIWLFTAYIVMQSYTANLSSNLTVSRLQRPTDKLYCIGFQDGSFVKEMLRKRLDFNVSRTKSYAGVEQYYDALSKGCHNGGVDAILDELPFIKIFLDKYGESNYRLQGSSYKTGGLGFAFPKGSALAPHISMALLNLTGSGEMHAITSKNFGLEYSDSDYSFDSTSHVSSIGTKSLAGLFIISGTMAILALLFSAPWFQQRLSQVYPSPASAVIELNVHSALEIRVDMSTTANNENSVIIPTQSDENGDIDNVIGQVHLNPNAA